MKTEGPSYVVSEFNPVEAFVSDIKVNLNQKATDKLDIVVRIENVRSKEAKISEVISYTSVFNVIKVDFNQDKIKKAMYKFAVEKALIASKEIHTSVDEWSQLEIKQPSFPIIENAILKINNALRKAFSN